jgi:hypothetical protein
MCAASSRGWSKAAHRASLTVRREHELAELALVESLLGGDRVVATLDGEHRFDES